MTLKHILQNSEYVNGVGKIYPIRLLDEDEFSRHSGILTISKKSLQMEDTHYKLLDTLILGIEDREKSNIIINDFLKIFRLVLRRKIHFVHREKSYEFISDDDEDECSINSENYDLVRQIIMKQNLIFEPKVFKDKRAQEWANKVLAVRAKNNKITIEDMITTVSIYSGIDINILKEYSKYQLQASFYRVNKIKAYDTSIQFTCAGGKDIEIPDYTGEIEMFKSPYDDIFVSKNKLGKIDEAMK